MATLSEKYDTAFLGILQNEGKIEGFLDAVIGFLFRRTDFFHHLSDTNNKLGFPPGVALKILTAIYKKYEKMANADRRLRQQELEKLKIPALPVARVEEVVTTTEENCEEKSCKSAGPEEETQNATCKDGVGDLPTARTEAADVQCHEGAELTLEGKVEGSIDTKDKAAGGEENAEQDDDLVQTQMQREYQENPDSYNGAIRDNFSWSQSINDADLLVKVAACVKKSSSLSVVIKPQHISVKYRDQDGNWVTQIDSDLCWPVKSDTLWTLMPGKHLHVNVEKVEERWWDAFFVDEEKISVRKIDASRPITSLDEEAQTKIEEMMFNQRQKQLGLPQSHELKTHEILKKAWDAEGSPFKGTPFDPSQVQVSPNNTFSPM